MIYEVRTYEAMPGKLRALVARFADITHPLFLKRGFRPVGYWTEAVGENNKLHYMLAWRDHAEREEKWAAFRDDPERVRAFAESEKDGLLVAKIANRIWEATAFSPSIPFPNS